MANSISRKTMIPLSLVGTVVVAAVGVIFWANAEHDTIGAKCEDRNEKTEEVLREDVKQVHEEVEKVDKKVDKIYEILIQMNGGPG